MNEQRRVRFCYQDELFPLEDSVIDIALKIMKISGHRQLRHGRHTDLVYFADRLTQKTDVAMKVIDIFAKVIMDQTMIYLRIDDEKQVYRNRPFDALIGVGGNKALTSALAFGLCRRGLPLEVFQTERKNEKLVLRTGLFIPEGMRFLISEDTVTTGESIRETIKLVRQLGGVPVGVVYLIDRSNGIVKFDEMSFQIYLAAPETRHWSEQDCPLCEEGLPLEN